MKQPRPWGSVTDPGSIPHALLELAGRIQLVDRLSRTDLAEFTMATTTDPSERAAALAVVALRHREAGDLDLAEQLLRSCIDEPGADTSIVTFASLRLVGLLAFMGRTDDADRILTELERQDGHRDVAPVLSKRAFISSMREQHVLALSQWRLAIVAAQDEHDIESERLARCGYATDLIALDSLNEAEYQSRLVLLAGSEGDRVRGHATRNLARVLARKGEIAEALHRLEQAESFVPARPWTACQIAITRAEALLSCRLLDEAERAAAVALTLSRQTHDADRAEALLLRAGIAIARRRLTPALHDLSAALELFEALGRTRRSERTERLLMALDPTTSPDFPLDALLSDTTLLEALYLTINRTQRPEDTIPNLQAIAVAVGADSIRQRVLGLSAAIQLAVLNGDRAEADLLVDALLDAGDTMCDGIGSVEMRSTVFLGLSGIEHVALAYARCGGPLRTFQLLDAAATRIHRGGLASSLDRELLEQLESLRGARRRQRGPDIDLRDPPSDVVLDGADARVDHEFAALEERIRFLSRRVAGASDLRGLDSRWTDVPTPTTPTASFLVASGTVWRCFGDGTGAEIERLCSLAAIDRALRRFRFSFDLAVNGRRPRLDIDAVRHAGDTLHALLLDGLPADVDLTLRLHRFLTDIPWRLLRPDSSGRIWANPGVPHRNDHVSMPRLERVAVIVGPDLGQPALEEAEAIAAIHPGARVLDRATVDDALDAIENADLVHLVGHGQPHPNDPLLASVRLHDGPLTAYDLERIHATPAVVVLAACGLGASSARSSGSTYGLPGVLLRRGTLSVMGSSLSIDNAMASHVMPDLHRSLADGMAPVDALANLPSGDHRRDLTARSVISMQSGPLLHRNAAAPTRHPDLLGSNNGPSSERMPR